MVLRILIPDILWRRREGKYNYPVERKEEIDAGNKRYSEKYCLRKGKRGFHLGNRARRGQMVMGAQMRLLQQQEKRLRSWAQAGLSWEFG